MPLALNDRVQETATANTTTSFTLSGFVQGFQSFAVIGDGNTTYYSAFDGAGNWEVGVGTYSTTGPTLTRDTILSSSNSNAAVTFPGTLNVFVTYPSSKSVYGDAATLVAPSGAILPVVNGGTGVNTSTGTGSVVLSASPTLTGTVIIGSSSGSTPVTLGRSTSTSTVNIGTGSTTFIATRTVNIATNGSGTDIVNIGRTTAVDGETTINIGTQVRALNATEININTGATGGNAITNIGSRIGGSFTQIYGQLGVSPTMFGDIVIGDIDDQGVITLGQSTSSQTTNIQANATGSAQTKTINIGTNGLAGSTTAITVGGTAGTSTTVMNGVTSFADGTVSAPSITNTGDENTGIFFPAADTIAFTEGGTEAMRIDNFGDVGIGTNNPTTRLHINGNSGLTISDSINPVITMNGTTATFYISSLDGGYAAMSVDGTSKGIAFGYGLGETYFDSATGRIGVGTDAPTTTLDVNGTGKFTAVNSPTVTAPTDDLTLNAISTGAVKFSTLGGLQAQVSNTASAANFHNLTGAAATNTPIYSVAGSDTNISMAFQSKGTGAINLVAGSSGVNISNGGTVTAITRVAAGTAYTTPPTWTASAPTTAGGVTATGTTTLGLQGAPTITSGGTGYAVGNVLTLVGGTGTATTLNVTAVSSGVITAVTTASNGSYTVVPTNPISVTGGAGSGATFTTTLWGIISAITIGNAGSGYIEQPTITFSGGGGSLASANAIVGSIPTVKSIGSAISFVTPSGEQLRVSDAVTAGQYISIARGGANTQKITAFGTANLAIQSTGGGTINFRTADETNLQLAIPNTNSAVNSLTITGAATTGSPVITSVGSDTNIDLTLISKGTGRIRFGAYTATVLTPTGFIEIKDSGGTTRRLLVG
jgi:hypothetical protein